MLSLKQFVTPIGAGASLIILLALPANAQWTTDEAAKLIEAAESKGTE